MRGPAAAERVFCSRVLVLGFVAILALTAGGCAVHPAPDVALDIQHEVSPASDVAADDQSLASVRASAGEAAPAEPQARAYLSPILAPPLSVAAGATDLTVMADRSLGGVWRLYTPHRLDVSFPGGFSYGRVVMHLCRIVQRGETVSGNCLLDKVTPIAGRAAGGHFNLSLNGIGFEGQVIGWNRIRGDFRLRVLGLGVTPPMPAGGERVVSAAGSVPEAGAESALRAAIADALSGKLDRGRYTEAGAKQLTADLPDLRRLGALDAVSYVDKQEMLAGGGHLTVFAADFAKDSRLCGVELAAGNQINRFVCA